MPIQYWKHLSNIFTFEKDSSDLETPKPEKIKKFWSFIKSLKKDAFWDHILRENRILKTDSKEKAKICNRQFQGLFQLFWEKAPGLNWEKICGILGYFGKFF